MRYPLLLAAALAWGLWFGATLAVFVFGWAFFHHLPADQFGPAVDAMFHAFARYQLGLAGAALLTAGLALVTYPSRWTLALVACCLAAGVTAVIFGPVLLPKMEILRHHGQVGTAAFKTLHGQSMVTLLVQVAALVGAAAALTAAAVWPPKPQRLPALPAPSLSVGT